MSVAAKDDWTPRASAGVGASSSAGGSFTAVAEPRRRSTLRSDHYVFAVISLRVLVLLVTREDANSDVVHPGAGKRRFVSPEWENRVSSVKVPPNCTAYVSVGNGVGKYPSDMAGFNDDTQDKGEAFGCECNLRLTRQTRAVRPEHLRARPLRG